MPLLPVQDLRDHLLAITSGDHSHDQLNAVVRICHSLSIACIRTRSIAAVLNDSHGLSVSDLAMDCIADLFQQSDQGGFTQLSAFFGSLPLENWSDEEALIHLRRLVFSKTYNGLFRLYNEADPILGKILRNIKIAIQSLGHFESCTEAGEPAIKPVACDPLMHLPPPDRDMLERYLSPHVRGNETIPSMLAKLSLYLREQRLHRRVIPMIDVAVVFRSLYSRPGLIPASFEDVSGELLRNDVERTLQIAFRHARAAAENAYVDTGKMNLESLDSYFRAINAGLRATYVDLDGVDFSLFEALRIEMPGLTIAEYRRSHRSRLEYLSRQMHERMRALLKNV